MNVKKWGSFRLIQQVSHGHAEYTDKYPFAVWYGLHSSMFQQISLLSKFPQFFENASWTTT